MIVDLTTKFSSTTPVFPGDTPLTITPSELVARDGCTTHTISLGTHVGTHIDAPAHVIAGAKTLDASGRAVHRQGPVYRCLVWL
jgi:kynurenine formamidase